MTFVTVNRRIFDMTDHIMKTVMGIMAALSLSSAVVLYVVL